jgi:hypothetical protein
MGLDAGETGGEAAESNITYTEYAIYAQVESI